MDRRERFKSPTADIRAAHAGFQSTLWTALPATVQSYSAAAMTVEAQPTIQFQSLGPTGVWTTQNMPLCVDCPVVFPFAGGFGLTLPIASGDEGLLVFASRCIDSWWQQGGVRGQAELRMHDLSDGFFIPGCFSQPRVLPNVSTTTAQLRNQAGDTYVEIAGGQVVNVVAPGGIHLNGVLIDASGNMTLPGFLEWPNGRINTGSGDQMAITGNVSATGTITALKGTGSDIGVSTHKHAQPNDSHGDAEQPTAAPTPGT